MAFGVSGEGETQGRSHDDDNVAVLFVAVLFALQLFCDALGFPLRCVCFAL